MSGDLVDVLARVITHVLAHVVLNVWRDTICEDLEKNPVCIDVAAFVRAFLELFGERSLVHSVRDTPGANSTVILRDVLISRVILQDSLDDETPRR